MAQNRRRGSLVRRPHEATRRTREFRLKPEVSLKAAGLPQGVSVESRSRNCRRMPMLLIGNIARRQELHRADRYLRRSVHLAIKASSHPAPFSALILEFADSYRQMAKEILDRLYPSNAAPLPPRVEPAHLAL